MGASCPVDSGVAMQLIASLGISFPTVEGVNSISLSTEQDAV